MKKIKYQSQRITLASGTASVDETIVEIDKNYDRITGYAVHSVSQNAADKFSLGLVDRSGVLHDRTFENDHISSTSVPMGMRYKKLNAEASGNQVRVQIEPVTALAAALTVDVVFQLESEPKECEN
ncbi:MAG: hypothetical protein WC967_14700 [Balneolaceae bacterium]